ncbi:MAG TPA: NO-inducible flavohemoprotein [Bacillales bacterium]|nr:NO-inducible flavohemoprotein [Bacillales bacterium]
MLDAKTMKIVKSTVPVLEKEGERITTRFYELLFQKYPELLNVFNHANQKKGRQQTALANAVYAAAAHIDQLEKILLAVRQIAHKHRSLGVKPEHYPLVGETLLEAIGDVLDLEEDSEIITAWAVAYQAIADAFIGVEKEMYAEAAEQTGGWEGFREFVVDQKVEESEVITSFYLKPKDGGAIASYTPGQYISVKLNIPGEAHTHIRQYSLSDAPGKDYYRLSVKREDENVPQGKISVYLHRGIKEGDVLSLSAPAGDFTLDQTSRKPVVLLSGGVGLTPLVSMVSTIVEEQPGREVTFIHAARNGNVHALRDEVAKIAEENASVRFYVCYDSPTDEDRERKRYDKEGYVTEAWLRSIVPNLDADYYFCGPEPFMRAMNHVLQEMKIPEEQIHYEFFGPSIDLRARETVRA